MPRCNKELNILNEDTGEVLVAVKCCKGQSHDGEHEYHVWTDDFNKATGEKGIIKLIKPF